MLQLLQKLSISSLLFLLLTYGLFAKQTTNFSHLLHSARLLPLASKSIISDLWAQNKLIFAVGERGHILSSKDGKYFKQLNSPADQFLTAITGNGRDQLWAVGHDSLILSSSDNGNNWNATHLNIPAESPLFDILYQGNQSVIAVGAYGYMVRSTDNGATWARLNIDVKIDEYEEPEDSEPHYFAIRSMTNGNLMIACEFGKLAELSPEGKLIRQIETGLDSSLFGLEIMNDQSILLYGLRGRIYTGTPEKGFKQLKNPKTSSLFGSFKNKESIYLAGADGTLLQLKDNQLIDLSLDERTVVTSGLVLAENGKIILGSTNGLKPPGGCE